MNTAVTQILKALDTLFQEQDKKIADRDVEWAINTYHQIMDFKKEHRARHPSQKMNTHDYYDALFRVAGGKTTYKMIDGYGFAQVEANFRKNAAKVATARNVRIANKLEIAGVKEVTETKVGYTDDGFSGWFRITTDKGEKIAEIRVILAGGFNIQRLHQRVICNVG